MQAIQLFIYRLSEWTGKAFSWCVLILTLSVSYEVFVRYALRSPTGWAYDVSYIMYGAVFIMAGAYTLSRDGHVRADVVYRLWRPRTQAIVDLVLYVIFFFPGIIALVYAGFFYARQSWMFQETSIFSPAGIPIWPLKMLIPAAGAVLVLQGISEVIRCLECIRTGQWPSRPHDVEELESAVRHAHKDAHLEEPADERARGGSAR